MPVCAVAGTMIAGANCAYTGHSETFEMSMAEVFTMLEDGALIIRSEDYKGNKTATEQACYKLGAACGFEVRKAIEDADTRIKKILPESKR